MNSNDELRAMAGQTAHRLLKNLDYSRAVVIATEDGFQMASASIEPVDAPRLAAIVSSLSAMGSALTGETKLGAVGCLMIEAEGGYLVIRSARRKNVGLVIAALTRREALLGLVIHTVNQAVVELAE
jgi:predicted regulator of Ras-like GTPase activity (Roadblock/LC7/MglB family)